MNNGIGRILTNIGKDRRFFRDRDAYPKEFCDRIEDLVSCNKANLSKLGGNGRVTFIDNSGELVVQLTIEGGNSYLSDESKYIILVRSNGGTITANAYYGANCKLDFNPKSETYNLKSIGNHIQALKDFKDSWAIGEGASGVFIVMVDRLDVFLKIIKDKAFEDVYILCSE